jgi:hypothetical protein
MLMRKWIVLSLIAILIFVGCSQTGDSGIVKTATITSVGLEKLPSIQVADNSFKATDDYMVYYYDKHNFVIGPSFTSSQTPVLLWVLDNNKSKHIDIKELLNTSGGGLRVLSGF